MKRRPHNVLKKTSKGHTMKAPKDSSFRGIALDKYEIYTVKVTDLGTHVEVRQYSSEMIRKKDDQKEIVKKDRLGVAERCSTMVFDRANAIRSFQVLRNLALANKDDWKSFITLTFAENVRDLDEANRKFHIYVTQIRKRFPGFKYLGVPEFQERGAVHYHLMTNIVANAVYRTYRKDLTVKEEYVLLPQNPVQRLWKPQLGRYLDLEYYDLPFWDPNTNGFSSAFTLDNVDQNFSITGYLAKYFWKNADQMEAGEGRGKIDLRLYGRIKVLHSRNLKKPDMFYLDNWDEDHNDWIRDQVEGLPVVASKEIKSTSEYVPNVTIVEFKR